MDIWAAAAQGNLRAVRRCLAAGADVDATVDAPGIPVSGATPLHLAVLFDQGAVARLLIETRANVNAKAKDKHGGTPLHWAAAVGRLEMAKRLIEAGADVNAPDNNGYTPLDAIHYDPRTRKAVKRKIADLIRTEGGRGRAEHGEESGRQ
jgi:ankyrin repeat protein